MPFFVALGPLLGLGVFDYPFTVFGGGVEVSDVAGFKGFECDEAVDPGSGVFGLDSAGSVEVSRDFLESGLPEYPLTAWMDVPSQIVDPPQVDVDILAGVLRLQLGRSQLGAHILQNLLLLLGGGGFGSKRGPTTTPHDSVDYLQDDVEHDSNDGLHYHEYEEGRSE